MKLYELVDQTIEELEILKDNVEKEIFYELDDHVKLQLEYDLDAINRAIMVKL